MKTTLDDTVKEFYSLQRHNFKVSHKHEDIRLSLGWTSVVIALGTTYYAYKLDDFQGTKNWVALGVTLYVARTHTISHDTDEIRRMDRTVTLY